MNDITGYIAEVFRLYKVDLGYSAAAAVMATLKHIQDGDSLRSIITNALMCGMVAIGIKWLMGVWAAHFGFEIDARVGWLAALALGYFGVKGAFQYLGNYIPTMTGLKRKQGGDDEQN
nr:holin/anti-holin [Klebsiella phage vB_Ko_K70PH128C1]